MNSQQCGKGAGAGLNSLPLCTLCANLGAQCCAAVLRLSCFFLGIQISHPKCTQLVQWGLYLISIVKKVDSKIRAVQVLSAQVSGLQWWGVWVCRAFFSVALTQQQLRSCNLLFRLRCGSPFSSWAFLQIITVLQFYLKFYLNVWQV